MWRSSDYAESRRRTAREESPSLALPRSAALRGGENRETYVIKTLSPGNRDSIPSWDSCPPSYGGRSGRERQQRRGCESRPEQFSDRRRIWSIHSLA
jgi:hypothetical protein